MKSHLLTSETTVTRKPGSQGLGTGNGTQHGSVLPVTYMAADSDSVAHLQRTPLSTSKTTTGSHCPWAFAQTLPAPVLWDTHSGLCCPRSIFSPRALCPSGSGPPFKLTLRPPLWSCPLTLKARAPAILRSGNQRSHLPTPLPVRAKIHGLLDGHRGFRNKGPPKN